jgi:YVTN family beta-propeller protein
MLDSRSMRRITVIAAAFLLGACTATPPVNPPPPGPRVYVSDETGGNVVCVDPGSRQIVQRIAVGKRPRGIRLSPDGTRLFVALSGSPIGGPGVDESTLPPADRAADGIGVIDVASGTLVKKYQSGQDPETFDISADGRVLYVSNEETSEMTALDLTSGAIVGRVKVGDEPEGVTVRPDQRLVYVACEGANQVFAVDREKLTVVARIDTPARPRAIAFTPDGVSAFISTENGGALVVFNPTTNTVIATQKFEKDPSNPVPPRPMGLAVTSDDRLLFVSLGRAKAIAVMGVGDGWKVRMIRDVGARPWGIAVSADNKTLYSANGSSGDISVIDIPSEKIVARIPVGGSPWGVALKSR